MSSMEEIRGIYVPSHRDVCRIYNALFREFYGDYAVSIDYRFDETAGHAYPYFALHDVIKFYDLEDLREVAHKLAHLGLVIVDFDICPFSDGSHIEIDVVPKEWAEAFGWKGVDLGV